MPGRVRKFFSAIFGARPVAEQILRSFEHQRQELRDQFFAQAAASGKPRGLTWKSCSWLDTYILVEDSQPGLLTMFCGVNVAFEAIEGSDMDGVEAVSMIRDGSAVFHHQNGRWGSGGRVLFNMNPQMAADTMALNQRVLSSSEPR
ncbi:MAG: hypothetical protein R3C59_22510 [Planctomycetaceae bacterium]